MRTENLIHPGEILKEEYLKPMGISSNTLAIALRVPATRIGDIIHKRRGINADTALRLGQYFNTTAYFWMNLQTNYDLQVALKENEQEINSIHKCTKLAY